MRTSHVTVECNKTLYFRCLIQAFYEILMSQHSVSIYEELDFSFEPHHLFWETEVG